MKLPHWRLLSAAVLVSFCGNFPMGYHTCVVNSGQGVFKRFLNDTYTHRYGLPMTSRVYSVLWAGCLSLYDLGAVLGVAFVPLLCDRMGRKWAIVWNCLPSFIGSAMFYFSHRLMSLELFMAGRLVMGVNGGFISGAQALFLTEASPSEFRGFIGSFQELSDCITSLTGMIFGLHWVLGSERQLDLLLAIPLIPSALLMVSLLCFPDTPKYQLLTKRDETAADHSIWFYHGATVNFEEAKAEILNENPLDSQVVPLRNLLREPITRKAVVVGIAANFAAVFTGIGAWWNFSTQLFTNVGANFQLSQYATVVMTAVNTVGTMVSMNFVDRIGRRPLLISSLIGCTLCNLTFLMMDQLKLHKVVMADWISYLSLGAAILFNLLYSVGAGPVPWFVGAEMSLQGSRATVQSLSVGSQWFSTVFDTIAFYPLYYVIGSYSLLVIFILPCALLTWFLAHYMPETRDLADNYHQPASSDDRTSLITPVDNQEISDPSAIAALL